MTFPVALEVEYSESDEFADQIRELVLSDVPIRMSVRGRHRQLLAPHVRDGDLVRPAHLGTSPELRMLLAVVMVAAGAHHTVRYAANDDAIVVSMIPQVSPRSAPLSFEDARAAAATMIGEGTLRQSGACPMIVDSKTVATGWGWIFCYEDKQRLETAQLRFSMVGNLPVVVRKDGVAAYLPCTPERSFAQAVAQYEATNGLEPSEHAAVAQASAAELTEKKLEEQDRELKVGCLTILICFPLIGIWTAWLPLAQFCVPVVFALGFYISHTLRKAEKFKAAVRRIEREDALRDGRKSENNHCA